MIDDRTAHLNLPLPNQGNDLADDVARLRIALTSVDGAINAIQTLLSSNDINLDTLQEVVNLLKADGATLVSLVDSIQAHASNTSNPHQVTKTQVGLGNVDNTSDANKPVSTAMQTALDAKQAALVSGTNIKTINGNSLPGSGDIAIAGTPDFVLQNFGII